MRQAGPKPRPETRSKMTQEMRYVAARLDGTTTVHSSQEALKSAKRRAKGERTIVDSWPEKDPPPTNGSAAEWDAYRNRQGYAGG